ncbi:MAG: Smr/MutS family protein [Erysipelotrichaceae bacterium]|nr:Smr/MutS family protein [Erysipelotrichaceae bacterium]
MFDFRVEAEYNIHGLTIIEALLFVERQLIGTTDLKCIRIIHGYINGSALKSFFTNYRSNGIFWINSIEHANNPGETIIFLKPSYRDIILKKPIKTK